MYRPKGRQRQSFFSSPWRQSLSSQYDSFIQEVVLKRLFFSDTDEISAQHIHISGLLGERALESVCWPCKDWFWTISTLWGWSDHERSDFWQFLLLESVVLLKELIFYISTLERCGGHERNDFVSLHFQSMWWTWMDWFRIIFILGVYGGIERTDFGLLADLDLSNYNL